MTSMQSAMNYLKRRFSDTNFNSTVPNGYMIDAEDDESSTSGPSSSQSSVASSVGKGSPAMQNQSTNASISQLRKQSISKTEHNTGGLSSSGGFFASLASGNPLAALKPVESHEKYRTILVIDDQHTDWSKYFKDRKLHNEYNLRVEQAEFKEISLSSHSTAGTTVDINCYRDGKKIVRSFKPDFVLIRQTAKSMVEGENFLNLIIGLKYGAVPSVNSLHSQYNFMDKPWVFAQLIRIQKKLGRDRFPLVEQTYYPSHKQMLTSSHFPIVVKIGHAHRGMAKFKVNNHYEFQDVVSVAALTNAYIVTETFVDAMYDIRVQKIGGNYKAFTRTSVSKNWKANTGSVMLEEITMTEPYKLWVDACSELLGGLDIVAVKAVHGKDGKDYILGITDCSMPLLGEKQEEDRKIIADLVIQRMTACIRPRNDRSKPVNRFSQSQMQLNRDSPPPPRRQNMPSSGYKPSTMSAPASCPPSKPPSVQGSAPSSPVTSRPGETSPQGNSVDGFRKRSGTVSEDEESNAMKIRNLRQSFKNMW